MPRKKTPLNLSTCMPVKGVTLDLSEALNCIDQIPDPRQPCKVEYPLRHLLLFSLAATLSQFDSFELMAEWSEVNGPWLLEHLGLPALERMPSHDTFRHLFRLLKPARLEPLIRAAAGAAAGPLDGRLVLIDGKALCGTWGPKADKDASLKVLNAYAPETHVVLGTRAVGAGTSETAQLPEFIESLNLKGATVCIDAAGSYKSVAGAIISKGANYTLTVKENQPSLHAALECFFQEAGKRKDKGATAADIRTATLESSTKGREVIVKLEACCWTGWLEGHDQWNGLRSVARMQRWRVDEEGASHHTTMYLISSLEDASAILHSAVNRWAIENSLHWVLDVTFGEDSCRTRDLNAAHNLVLIRRLAINLLKQEGSKKSMKAKRLLCATSPVWLCRALEQLSFHA